MLAGGGARASFQLGALERLLGEERLAFDTVAGTSAGAILGGVIAQRADNAGQHRAIAELTRAWRDMRDNSAIFRERPWFSLLQDQAPVWQQLLRGDATSRTPRTIEIPSFTWPWSKEPAAEPLTVTLPGMPQTFSTISGLWNLAGPGSGFDSIAKGALRSSSVFTPGPVVDRIVEEIFDPDLVAHSGVRSRFSVVSLESGELRYVDGQGRLRDRDDVPLGVDVDLTDAIAASCAIPGIFPPVRLGDEHYVDGGVRMNLPADIVFEHLPVDRCYVISSAPAGVQHDPSFARSTIVSTMMRAGISLAPEELAYQERARARAQGGIMIDPQTEIHDAMTVEPGLIALAIDYGYLRAAQVVSGADEQEQRLARHLVEIRRLLWAIEAQEDPQRRRPESESAVQRIVEQARVSTQVESPERLRRTVRDLTRALPDDHLPDGAFAWGHRPEYVPVERTAGEH